MTNVEQAASGSGATELEESLNDAERLILRNTLLTNQDLGLTAVQATAASFIVKPDVEAILAAHLADVEARLAALPEMWAKAVHERYCGTPPSCGLSDRSSCEGTVGSDEIRLLRKALRAAVHRDPSAGGEAAAG